MNTTLEPSVFEKAPPAPQVPGGAILGSLRPFTNDRLLFLDEASRLGPVVGFRVGARPFHLVVHPDGVKRVLVDNAASYGKQTRGLELLRTVLGDGLVTSEGDLWRRQRRLAQPAFHKDRIAAFVPLMVGATRALAESWAAPAARGEVVDADEAMMKLTLTIVGRALLSTDLSDRASTIGNALTTVLEDFNWRTTSLLDLLFGSDLPTPRNRRMKAAIRTLDEVVAATIAERRRAGGEHDLLGMLMAARDVEGDGQGLSDKLLRDQVLTMILAGHETTANALTWTWILLSRHPAVARRVRAEVDQVLAGRDPTADDLPRLPWVKATVEEAMRLYPPVWTLARSVVQDDVVCGHRIAAGSFVLMSPWVTHRLPQFWPNPEGFDPERFLEPDPARPRFAYYPFGGGARQCIGNTFALAEAQVIVAMLLQRFRLDLEPGQRIVPEPLITLRPSGGAKLRLAPR